MPAVAPSEFPPPFDSDDVIGPLTDAPEDRIEVGVAIVGGGPAGLACANKLMQLLEDEPELTEKLGEVPVAVIEKGKVAGAHLLSGANVDPSAMERLFPDLPPAEWPPVYQEVTKDATYFLTKSKAFPLKPPPPNFRKEGTYTMSVSKLGRFLAEKAEEAGVYILTETAATQLLVEDRIVKGVRSGDRGRGKEGQELGNFEPGSDVVAKATVLAEGTIGHLTYAAYGLLRYARGLRPAGLGARGEGDLGGPQAARPGDPHAWLAAALERRASRRRAAASSTRWGRTRSASGSSSASTRPTPPSRSTTPCSEFKTHPFIKKIIEGGKRVGWGAKTIPSGGYWALPKRFSVPGMLMAGDAAGMVNIAELAGVHYAMHAGMYAAEAIVESLKKDIDSVNFESYDEKIRGSVIEKDLYQLAQHEAAADQGADLRRRDRQRDGRDQRRLPRRPLEDRGQRRDRRFRVGKAADSYPKADNELTFNKLDSVFLSGNATRDDAPNHVRIQTHVPREIAQTWVSMCPAQVYEIPEDQLESGAAEVDVHVTASNCVQCGAITAKGGRLTLPEGGDGPLYQET